MANKRVQTQFEIPAKIAQALIELTEEPRPEVALRLVIKDAIEHRLEQVKAGLQEYRGKYTVSFSTFKKKWNSGEIIEKYSYPIEKDYWEWEGLVSRQATLKRLKQWL